MIKYISKFKSLTYPHMIALGYFLLIVAGTILLSLPIASRNNIMIVLLMYSGRVGSLSFALLFTENRVLSPVQNPMEKINIG